MDQADAIPDDHPRAASLRARERLVAGIEAGMTSQHGLIAHGRGEAIDYLLGERTIPSAAQACRAAAAALLDADRPVISVNGNVAALVPDEVVTLSEAVGAPLEVNLFHRSRERIEAIEAHLRHHGAKDVLGTGAAARIPGLSHDRAIVHEEGIFAADVVLVPLEDGDRAAALGAMGKTEVVIDLNPLSRSSQVAAIPICDNIVRALPLIVREADELRTADDATLAAVVNEFDPDAAREAAEAAIRSGDLAGVGT
ncbi:MAG: 4-phosphopantoate--beta-alanine ligase [Halobacteriota archaeon]